MPFPSQAIRGQKSPQRTRQRVAREAKEEIANLPDWMFWKKESMEKYLDEHTSGQAKIRETVKEIGEFIRLAIRLMGYYEERPGEGE